MFCNPVQLSINVCNHRKAQRAQGKIIIKTCHQDCAVGRIYPKGVTLRSRSRSCRVATPTRLTRPAISRDAFLTF
jgi:hypothetical protein